MMDYKNRFIYNFNEKVKPENNQILVSPCIEIDNNDIKLARINQGLKDILSPQNENIMSKRIMLAKSIVLNFNEPLYKKIDEVENNEQSQFIKVDDMNDTLKNRFDNNKLMFSIITQPIFQDMSDFVDLNPNIYDDAKIFNIFRKAYDFHLLKESQIGALVNLCELSLKSDSDGNNINMF